jgi:hypothetical protein
MVPGQCTNKRIKKRHVVYFCRGMKGGGGNAMLRVLDERNEDTH